jgi:hypothetical protein
MILNGSAPQDVMGRSPPIVNAIPVKAEVFKKSLLLTFFISNPP